MISGMRAKNIFALEDIRLMGRSISLVAHEN
jgi:hypothetical protein